MTPLLLALLLADPFPPQNQPVNITQVSGTPVSGSVPVTCVAGCGGGSGGSGGGGASWDAGVIVQYPVAVASLWDGGVIVLNFPAVQAVSQASFPWITQIDPDGGPIQVACVSGCGGGSGGGGSSWDAGVLVQNFPASFGASQSGPWSVLIEYDAGPLPVSGSVSVSNFPSTQAVTGTVSVLQDTFPWQTLAPPDWDAGVEVLNFPNSFGASQTGNWAELLVYDGGPLPVSSTQAGNWAELMIYDGGPIPVSGFPVVQAVSIVDGGVGASQQGNWAVLMLYDGGALPVAGIVTADQGTVPWQVSQSGAWTTLLYYDGGNIPVSASESGPWAFLMVYDGGSLPVSGSVSVTFPTVQAVSVVDGGIGVTNFPTVQAVSLVDGGSWWDAGYLAYTYAGPLPVDTSYQTSCTNGVTFCGTTSTALTACSGGKWQDFQNQSSQNIYICAQAGCSAPTAIDAGTVVGEAVPPMATYFANGSAQYWCVVPTSAQNSPDAGTVTKCCK